MENKIVKLEQRVEQLEKILRMYNDLLYKVINHIGLETVTDLIGDVHNDSSGDYHKALRKSQKILEERQDYDNYSNAAYM